MFTVGPSFFAGQSGGDPLFSSVVGLFHMDGTQGGTSFPNQIVGLPAAIRQGSIKPFTTTTEFEFPTASAQFFTSPFATGRTGEESWLEIDSSSGSLSFGTGDFCFEGWFYPSYTNGIAMFCNSTPTQWFLWINTSGYLEWFSSGGTITSTGQLLPNQWNYVAMDRNSGTVRLYINGNQVGTGTDTSSINATGYMSLGRSNGGAFYNWYGFIDEVRITAASRYTTSTIPVPTQPFPDY